MNKIFLASMLLLVSMLLCTGIALAEGYPLGAGDVISIEVWGHDEFKAKEGVTIRPDGKISFPLVGEIEAAGLESGELTNVIVSGLKNYLCDPKVNVNVIKYHTVRVYVLGEVNKPGMYEIEKQHNLLDAISIAGGYTKDAAKKKVLIIHKDNGKEPTKINLLEILKKGDMTKNYALTDGEVVFLSENGRFNFGTDILPWVAIGSLLK